MKVIDDGVIKYDRSNFTQSAALEVVEYSALESWRKIMFQHKLIGEYEKEKVGFGNASEIKDYQKIHQTDVPQFVITGSQTGKFPFLDGRHYTRVLDYKIDELKIVMMGPIEASSESLTHAAIYAHNPNIKAIFHIHSKEIWEGMIKDHYDFTPKEVPYGTVEMAHATEACVGNNDHGVFCMHGHEDGVVAYGRSLDEAGQLIMQLHKKYIK